MKIEKIKISQIIPYKNNAKIHTKEQIQQIMKSIEEFGMNDPIAIDENNIIIEGHGRLLALKELGYEEVDCIRLSHLTEEQRKAYTLIHNKLTMNTGFDIELLNIELENITGIDMSDFDFDIDLSLEEEPVQIEEDNYIEGEHKQYITHAKLGDVYQLGKHRLMCGDSTNHENVEILMGGGAC